MSFGPEKTQEETNEEINRLREMQPKVRRYTAFGDDNHEAIEAEIQALEENATEEETYDWEKDGEFSQHACESARSVILWRDGEEDESPSESWEPLVKRS
jgi:hypothetical protein